MTDQIREQMSALINGELPRDEVGLLVGRMARDAELKRAFGNYVLAGESLRAPGGVLASPGFAARVSAALGDGDGIEAVAPAEPARAPLRWRRPLAATAVAASAALAAVLLVRPDGGQPPQFAERAGAPETLPVVVSSTSIFPWPPPAANRRRPAAP